MGENSLQGGNTKYNIYLKLSVGRLSTFFLPNDTLYRFSIFWCIFLFSFYPHNIVIGLIEKIMQEM